ncbi:unnamed protein product, partial [Symbiodinium necroappetens]
MMKGKAPSTILKRARALVLLQDFLNDKNVSFPCLESDVYDFLKTLERDGAPPSRISSIMEVLHDALEKHADQWTRVFAGACLVCCYSRCRWSDVQHTEAAEQATQVFACDFACPWNQTLRAAMEDLSGGSPTVRALDTDEATSWMRLMLGLGDESLQVSSKSMKATIISWAAKRGVDPLTLQRLGYHAAGGMDLVYSRDAQAPLLLVVEKVLKEVREGIFRPDETRSGRLVSIDAKPLAGSFVPGLGEASVAEGSPVHEHVPAACKVEVASAEATDAAIISISDSEASDSLGESSEESDEDFGQPIAFVARGQVIPAGFDLWRHSSSQ